MDIKLIAFDLDGTFLTNKKEIPKENLEAIKKAAEKGAIIVPASGRFYSGMPKELRDLPFIRYAITINGAEVWDLKENKVVYECNIPYEKAEEIFDYLEKLPVIFDCYQDDSGWLDQKYYPILEDFIEDEPIRNVTLMTRKKVDNFRALMKERARSVQKIQALFKDMDLRKKYLEILPKEFPDMNVVTSLYNNIEITAPLANKGIALEKLCEYLNLPLENTIAFGDGTNDIEMIETAGIGVSMANGDEKTKAIADIVTLTNEECGFAKTLNEFMDKIKPM